jgi:PBSX family phage terminase large subunit
MGKGLSANDLVIPSIYKEVFLDNYNRFVLSSGRISGKTSVLVALWWATHNKYPEKDIVILHATQTEIKESIINEIKTFLMNSGIDGEYDIPESATTIKKRDRNGVTYFYPITDYKGGQRTRGVNTINPISLVLYEECQKNKDANVVEQSIATFVRQLDQVAKIVIVGNNETIGHWFIDFVQSKIGEGWHYIYANCYDIWELLTDSTKKYIEEFRKNNEIEFRRMFLGDIYASASDVVFPQFKRAEHYKSISQLDEKYITTIIVGIDHATANDTFAVVPVAILDDGTTQTLEIMYSDPEETNASLAPTEQCELLDRFLHWLDEKYGIVYNNLIIYLSIDGAASPFIAQVRHTQNTSEYKQLWKQIKIKPFTMKKKDINMGIIKNAFAYGVLTILNEGATMWNGVKNSHRLRDEIERQRYKGLTRKLDPAIKNDLVDALEYGLIPYYINTYNISFPVRKNNDKSKRKEIMELAKKR